MDQTLSEDNMNHQEAVFRMVTHVSDNSNFSQEIFCNRHLGSCNMLFRTWSQAHA